MTCDVITIFSMSPQVKIFSGDRKMGIRNGYIIVLQGWHNEETAERDGVETLDDYREPLLK